MDWSSCPQLFWIWHLMNSVLNLTWPTRVMYLCIYALLFRCLWFVCVQVICISMKHISGYVYKSLGESVYAPWQPNNFSIVFYYIQSNVEIWIQQFAFIITRSQMEWPFRLPLLIFYLKHVGVFNVGEGLLGKLLSSPSLYRHLGINFSVYINANILSFFYLSQLP